MVRLVMNRPQTATSRNGVRFSTMARLSFQIFQNVSAVQTAFYSIWLYRRRSSSQGLNMTTHLHTEPRIRRHGD